MVISTTKFFIKLTIILGVFAISNATMIFLGSNLTPSINTATYSDTNTDTYNDQFTYNFGSLVNTGLLSGVLNNIAVFEIVLRVPSVTANVAGGSLTVDCTVTSTLSSTTSTAAIDIVEPSLAASTSLSPLAPVGGQRMEYSVTVSHNANSGYAAGSVNVKALIPSNFGTLVNINSTRGTISTDSTGFLVTRYSNLICFLLFVGNFS